MEGLINSVFQPANSQNTGDLTGFCSKLRINQTFLMIYYDPRQSKSRRGTSFNYLHSFPSKYIQVDSPDLTFQVLINGR